MTSLLRLLIGPPRVITAQTIQQHTIRRILARPGTPNIVIRQYSTGGPPPRNVGNLLTSALDSLWKYLPSVSKYLGTTEVQTPAPPQTAETKQPATTPPTTKPSAPATPPQEDNQDPWAGEGAWTATDWLNFEIRPCRFPWLFRKDDDDVHWSVRFRDGLRARGTNFGLKNHQGRSLDSLNNTAFYGACINSKNVVYDSSATYVYAIHDACGVGVQNQWGNISIVEDEIAVHIVPPHRFAAVLIVATGEVHVNELASKEAAAKGRELLTFVWNNGIKFGDIVKQ
jgi:hypothetical protein